MTEGTEAPRRASQIYPLEFTASGSEYFRIWIVNLLLIAITFGIYLPWAKVRKLRYFYSNTLIDGHALDFHGEARKMLRGTLVVGAFLIVYSIAAEASGWAGLLSAVVFALLWPLLYRASMRFRLSNTSWRGLRLHFTGDVAGAYAAVLPPLLLTVVPLALGGALGEPNANGRGIKLPAGFDAGIGAAILIFVVTLPYFIWRLKRYQHSNYACGELRTEFRAGVGSFYGIALRTIGVAILGGVIMAAGGALFPSLVKAGGAVAVLFGALLVVFAVIFFNAFLKAYVQLSLQNLVWTRTGNRSLRFRSDLQLNRYVGVQVKNFVLIFLTLGFYWPFAVVATMRARTEAVSLHTVRPLDELTGSAARAQDDAAGDAAADMFGLDLGL